MRRKKHKHTRRAVSFYKLSYGFHDPYKVLLDGNFIHATLSANLPDLSDHISRLLGARSRLYVTRCVTRELEDLGPDLKQALHSARRCELHKCGHEKGEATAAECLQQQIGDSNASHWWVATQDRALRQSLGQVAGCPLIFATVNGIHLEEPAGLSKSTALEVEEAHQVVPEHERSSTALVDLEDLRKQAGPRGPSIFKRKKTKGPNPLAMKKKITKKLGTSEGSGGATNKTQRAKATEIASGGARKDTAGERGSGIGGGTGEGQKRKRKRGKAAKEGVTGTEN